jgi:N-acetylglucosamine kinase-like BadF-type ATPase
VLVRDDGAVLGVARGPGCSPHRLGLEASLGVLDDIVARLDFPTDLAVLLLAAIDFPDEEAAYRRAAEERGWAKATLVDNDTRAVLRAGTERGFGVAVTCGAGINCLGVAPDGREVRFPSLGPLSGDWGGGSDVGLAAVAAAARSEDGRGSRTALERLVPEHFGLRTPVELARALHEGHIPQHRLAELAPPTFAAAATDEVAGAIVDRLADEVVALARAALTRLDLTAETVDVVLGGGLLQSGNGRLLARIETGLRKVGTHLRVAPAKYPPVVGAALLALDRLGAGAAARGRLRAELPPALARD